MTGSRKRHPAAFKARVALEAAKQTKTVAELAKAYQVHPVQISQWKKQLLDGVETLFRDGRREIVGRAVEAQKFALTTNAQMRIIMVDESPLGVNRSGQRFSSTTRLPC